MDADANAPDFNSRRRWIDVFLGLTLVLAISGTGIAQDAYPAKPVTIVVPYAPGNTLEFEIRTYAEHLSNTFRRPFVIDLKPGAAAAIGTAYVAKAAPDGYTLLATTASLTVVPSTFKDPPFDPAKDFSPISILSKSPSLLVVNPALPVKTVQEFIAYARSRPNPLNIATSGHGGLYHVAAAWLQGLTGTAFTFVPYKGGNEMNSALISGVVEASLNPPLSTLPLAKSGRMRIIGATERSRMFPDIPSIEEQGVPGYRWSQWTGVMAPARTPQQVVDRLAAEFARIARLPEVIGKLENGKEVVGSTPEYFRQLIANEVPRWRKVVIENSIKADD